MEARRRRARPCDPLSNANGYLQPPCPAPPKVASCRLHRVALLFREPREPVAHRVDAGQAQPSLGRTVADLHERPPRRFTIVNACSSVASSPRNTGARPRNGASAMNSAMAVPLSRPTGRSSTTIFPSWIAKAYPERKNQALAERRRSEREMRREPIVNRDGESLVLDQHARMGRCECRELGTELPSRVANSACRCIAPAASRRSNPCWPATGRASGANRRSTSAIPRPVISASAPPLAAWARRSSSTVSGSIATASGVAARCSSVPSTSRNSAISAAARTPPRARPRRSRRQRAWSSTGHVPPRRSGTTVAPAGSVMRPRRRIVAASRSIRPASGTR